MQIFLFAINLFQCQIGHFILVEQILYLQSKYYKAGEEFDRL